MTKIVATVFRAIMFAMIFVIVWDVTFYLYRVNSLNQQMESVLVTMQQEVSNNNYLTPDAYEMYKGMLEDIQYRMNSDPDEPFVRGFDLNYYQDCVASTSSVSGLTFSKKLSVPADYGDVAIIELSVGIYTTNWFFDPTQAAEADSTQRRALTNRITYTYQVPCLKYISITS